MSKIKQIAALTAMLVGVILYASPAKSAVCFLPDDDGSCGGGDIEISDGSDDNKPEEKCDGFTVSATEYEKMKNCFDFTSCTKSKTKEVKYKQGGKISGTSWNASNKICCTNGETYDSAEGQCCPAGGCTHECDAPKEWSTTLRSCECPKDREENTNHECCLVGEHADGAICCPEKKHNDGGKCVCDSQYNTDDNGNCVIAGDECPKGYTENKPSSAYKYETKNVGSKVCYKIVDGNWPKTIRVRLETEYYVSNGKYKHIITGANLTFETQDGTVVSSDSFKDEGLPKFQYLYKEEGDDVMKLDMVHDTERNDTDNTGGFYFLSDPKALFLEFDEAGFYFKDFVMNTAVQDVQEWKQALFLRFGSGEWQETSQWTNPLSFKGDISLGNGQRVKEKLDLQLDVTVYSRKITNTCSEIDSSYVGAKASCSDCGNPYYTLEDVPNVFGSDGQCKKCLLDKCNDIDSDWIGPNESCEFGYRKTKLEARDYGSDGQCYECTEAFTNVIVHLERGYVEGSYEDGEGVIGSQYSNWSAYLEITDPEVAQIDEKNYTLPFDMQIETMYSTFSFDSDNRPRCESYACSYQWAKITIPAGTKAIPRIPQTIKVRGYGGESLIREMEKMYNREYFKVDYTINGKLQKDLYDHDAHIHFGFYEEDY